LNEFIIIARRNNNDWYVGSITNHTARKLDLSFSFLEKGRYTAEIYKDAQDSKTNPNHLIREIKSITNSSHLSLLVSAGGGFVIKIKKVLVN
jgi:alpha-glucosidase